MRLVDKKLRIESIGEPAKVRDLSGRSYVGAVLMWYGYAIEAI
jgi:hypothetical protein